ncbi:transcription initiation factor TFIIA [Pseudoscourfieldia marina]
MAPPPGSDPPPAPPSEPAVSGGLHFSAHASYLNVINHVIASLRPVFFQEGAGELELDMLKKTWMLKIEQAGIAPAPGATVTTTPAITHAAAVPPNSGSKPETVPQSAPLSSAAPDTSAHALAAATQPSEEPQKEAAAAAGTKRKREDEDAGGEGAAATAAAEDDDGDGDDLNSDDDDDDDEAALATKDLLLAQYESVHHAKGKWRIALKAGVVHVNGRDVPFSTAKAELQF